MPDMNIKLQRSADTRFGIPLNRNRNGGVTIMAVGFPYKDAVFYFSDGRQKARCHVTVVCERQAQFLAFVDIDMVQGGYHLNERRTVEGKADASPEEKAGCIGCG